MRHTSHRKSGFTLVEVAVLMPLIILLIGGLIASILYLANNSLRSQGRSKVRVDVLAALDRMEQDVRNTYSINSASPANGEELILTSFATSKDPLNPDRRLIASDCTIATTGLMPADAATYQIRYRKQGTTLTREVTVTPGGCSGNSNVWQRNGTETLIKDADVTLSVLYPSSSTTNPSIASITLTAGRSIAGQTISFTGSMYARSGNIK